MLNSTNNIDCKYPVGGHSSFKVTGVCLDDPQTPGHSDKMYLGKTWGHSDIPGGKMWGHSEVTLKKSLKRRIIGI